MIQDVVINQVWNMIGRNSQRLQTKIILTFISRLRLGIRNQNYLLQPALNVLGMRWCLTNRGFCPVAKKTVCCGRRRHSLPFATPVSFLLFRHGNKIFCGFLQQTTSIKWLSTANIILNESRKHKTSLKMIRVQN